MIDCMKDCALYGTASCAYPMFKHHSSCLKFKSKVMEEDVKEKLEVKFLSSLAMAVDALDGIKHVQLTLVQEVKSKTIRCYMDVVDPSKVKLADAD